MTCSAVFALGKENKKRLMVVSSHGSFSHGSFSHGIVALMVISLMVFECDCSFNFGRPNHGCIL